MSKENYHIVEKALQRARDEYEEFDGSDFVGNRAVFILCQHLEPIIDRESISVEDLDFLVRQWYDLCDGLLVDEDREQLSYTEIWAQFIDVWENERVRFPKIDYLALALERAKTYEKPRPEVAHLDSPKIQLLAHTCYELQQLRQDNQFFIAQEDAGRIIGKGQKEGRLLLNLLISEGVLVLIEKGRTGFASTYSYVVNLSGSKRRMLTKTEFERKRKAALERLKSTESDRENNKR
ncbi:MAG: hypothetical protein GWN62_22610 [Aliifodinibius sp.]|nr:hypothetical protein [Fodinibius sp.]